MAQSDMLKRYLDAGVAFTKMTQERAEAIVRELVGAGEVGAEQASSTVQELVDRSRENTDRLLDTVRAEINAQIGNLGLATREDVEGLRREIASLRDAAGTSPAQEASATPPAAPGAPATKGPQKKKTAAKRARSVEVPATEAPAAAVKAPAAKKAAKRAAPTKRS